MQAARGTPLTAPTPPDRTAGRARLLLAAVALAAYAVDVSTKVWAVRTLTGRGPVRVVGDLLRLDLYRNPGAAFSTGVQYTVALSLLAIAAVCVVLVLARRVRSRGWALALGFLLAGVGGNLTDRLFRAPGPLRGHVVDFLQLPHWPVFNVADMCIDTAAVLIVILTLRGIRLDGSRVASHEEDQA